MGGVACLSGDGVRMYCVIGEGLPGGVPCNRLFVAELTYWMNLDILVDVDDGDDNAVKMEGSKKPVGNESYVVNAGQTDA